MPPIPANKSTKVKSRESDSNLTTERRTSFSASCLTTGRFSGFCCQRRIVFRLTSRRSARFLLPKKSSASNSSWSTSDFRLRASLGIIWDIMSYSYPQCNTTLTLGITHFVRQFRVQKLQPSYPVLHASRAALTTRRNLRQCSSNVSGSLGLGSRLLRVSDFAVREGDLQILVHVDDFGADGDLFVRRA